MSLKNKLFREMFKMSSAATQQASTKAPSHKLSCYSGPNPTRGSTQLMDNSDVYNYLCRGRVPVKRLQLL